MNIKECFETGSFNEMIQFSFDEVRAAFNLNKYFVLDEHGEEFISEAIRVKNWYNDELNQIESYSKGEYTSNINLGIKIPDYDMWLYATITIWESYSRVYYELNVVKIVVKSFPLCCARFPPEMKKSLETLGFQGL